MKNIHVLPTDKPSRLVIYNSKLKLVNYKVITPSKNQQNIYITSDEEIKEGDWILKCKNVNDWNFKSGELQEKDYSYFKIKCISLALLNPEDKKIILTTDQELIKDGVQAIDDEFLEWFVKNPSYESVEVVSAKTIPALQLTGNGHCWWKIIIPQEEPKQGYICPQTKKQCDDECCVSAEDCHIKSSTGILSDSKQETLEEAEQETLLQIANRKLMSNDWLNGAEFGAKWQQEQDNKMYSEEEMLELLHKFGFDYTYNYKGEKTIYEWIPEWFEEYKRLNN
jgi:hypothetical protein